MVQSQWQASSRGRYKVQQERGFRRHLGGIKTSKRIIMERSTAWTKYNFLRDAIIIPQESPVWKGLLL